MKIEITKKTGDEDGKKPTPAELAAANKFVKSFAVRKIPLIGENAHVGDTVPKFIDSATGKEAVAGPSKLPPRTVLDINKIPTYVKDLQIDHEVNVPYYIDQSTGDIQYVHPDFLSASRFNPNRGMNYVAAAAPNNLAYLK